MYNGLNYKTGSNNLKFTVSFELEKNCDLNGFQIQLNPNHFLNTYIYEFFFFSPK